MCIYIEREREHEIWSEGMHGQKPLQWLIVDPHPKNAPPLRKELQHDQAAWPCVFCHWKGTYSLLAPRPPAEEEEDSMIQFWFIDDLTIQVISSNDMTSIIGGGWLDDNSYE